MIHFIHLSSLSFTLKLLTHKYKYSSTFLTHLFTPAIPSPGMEFLPKYGLNSISRPDWSGSGQGLNNTEWTGGVGQVDDDEEAYFHVHVF